MTITLLAKDGRSDQGPHLGLSTVEFMSSSFNRFCQLCINESTALLPAVECLDKSSVIAMYADGQK